MISDMPIVQTAEGRVRGRWRAGSAAFLNIPYAQPPVNDLRFEAPVPPTAWGGVRDALEYGPTPQRRGLGPVTTIPEPSILGPDILNLNVFAPGPFEVAGPGSGLPVLVWIHGGGFIAGSPASPWYDGAAFNRSGVIVVTISYRLGFEGFGWLPDAPLNRGMLDCIAALQWVQSNITAFGGDPRRVTVGGQSAGGGAVLALMKRHDAVGLFSQALIMSGSSMSVSPESAMETTDRVAERLGIGVSKRGFASVSEEALLDAQLSPLPAGDGTPVERAMAVASFIANSREYGPVEEGLDKSVPNDVPTLIGATRDEFSGFIRGVAADVNLMKPQTALDKLGAKPAITDAYLEASNAPSVSWLAEAYLNDSLFRHVIPRMAAQSKSPVWAYQFQWEAPTGFAGHCIDLPFAFNRLESIGVREVLGNEPPAELAACMHSCIATFCATGNPGWNPITGTGPVMIFDRESGVTLEDPYETARVFI